MVSSPIISPAGRVSRTIATASADNRAYSTAGTFRSPLNGMLLAAANAAH
jgi:hypothetical protein